VVILLGQFVREKAILNTNLITSIGLLTLNFVAILNI
jgi:hypothetical protein